MILHVKEAKPGMVLQRDLVHDDKILLKAHSVLSEAMISVFKIRGISHVDVQENVEHTAPGADVYYKMAIDSSADAEYQKKKQAINDLFSSVEGDDQMQVLKYCLVRQLEEEHGEQD